MKNNAPTRASDFVENACRQQKGEMASSLMNHGRRDRDNITDDL